MKHNKEKKLHRITRHRRVRSKISGTSKIPRLSVFRSNKYIFAQIIDDGAGKTIVSSAVKSKAKAGLKGKKSDIAKSEGRMLAEKALEKGVKKVVFDRGGFKYQGRVKAFADGAREGGLKF